MQFQVQCPVCPVHLDSHESFQKSGFLIDQHIIQKHPKEAEALEADVNEKFRDPSTYRSGG